MDIAINTRFLGFNPKVKVREFNICLNYKLNVSLNQWYYSENPCLFVNFPLTFFALFCSNLLVFVCVPSILLMYYVRLSVIRVIVFPM